VDTTVISLGECGITENSETISQICTHASDWDGAEKSSCKNANIPVVANRTDPYERCIFALNELELGEYVTIVKENKENQNQERHEFDYNELPVDVNRLSQAIESVNKPGAQSYKTRSGETVLFSPAEFLDFKRTGDALQVMSVKRLNKKSKDAAAQQTQDGNVPMNNAVKQTLPIQQLESEEGVPNDTVVSMHGDKSDNESIRSAASVTDLASYQLTIPSSPNRLNIHAKPSVDLPSIYGSPRPPSSSQTPVSPSSLTHGVNRKPLRIPKYNVSFPPSIPPYSPDSPHSPLHKKLRQLYGGTVSTTVHAFVTVDSLAFLKARLNGVPSIFTFTDFNTRERIMYLYKPEVANIKLYWENTYKDLVTKCKIYVANYQNHTAKPENYVNFVDMVVGKATGGFFATDEASLREWNELLVELKYNMETTEDALNESRVSFIKMFRNLLISRYREISVEHLVQIFTQGFDQGAKNKLCPTNKMMSMFKGLLDAQETITALEGKISQQTRQSQHSSGKILHAAKNLGTNILKIVACTVLIEIYNKVCLFLTNFKKGAIADIYTEIDTLTNVLWDERTDMSLVQQKCVKMTSFLERYNELNNLLAQPGKGSILTQSIGCGIDYAMYSTLFGNIASCLSPFLHKNPNNLNGASREIANTRVGLRHLFVGSTNREQDKIYKLMAKRVEEEMVRPICDITKSISKQIINSLYVPNIDETYRRMDIHRILMDHLKEFDDLMHLQAGGVGSPNGSPNASPTTSGIASTLGSTPNVSQRVSMFEPSQDPYKNSPPTPTSLPAFKSEFKHPDSMYSPDELYCALMGDSITKEQFELLSPEDEKDYHEVKGNKYAHKVRLIAQQMWAHIEQYTSNNSVLQFNPVYLAELTDFAMFTDPELLLRINTSIMLDKFTSSKETPFIDEQLYVKDRKSMEDLTSSVNKYIKDNTDMQEILRQQLFVHDTIKENITIPVTDESLLDVLVSVLGPELTNMRGDQETIKEYQEILEYYKFLYTDYNPFKGISSSPSGPATGGHKVRWSLEDYHRKYYPPYAQLYYDTV
jgi:hypothetical protein